jgi:hypothetical protein
MLARNRSIGRILAAMDAFETTVSFPEGIQTEHYSLPEPPILRISLYAGQTRSSGYMPLREWMMLIETIG